LRVPAAADGERGRAALADIDLDRIWDGVGGCFAIRRAALHAALRRATAEVPVRLGMAATDVEDGEAPLVSFSDGSIGRYDLVVGADGVHSTIRSLVVGGPAASYVGQASWRFVADGFPDINDWTVMLGRGCTFLTVALGHGVVYCYDTRDTRDPASAAGEDWRQSFTDFADPIPRLLDKAAEAYFATHRGGRAAGLDSSPRRAHRRRRPRQLTEHGPRRGDGEAAVCGNLQRRDNDVVRRARSLFTKQPASQERPPRAPPAAKSLLHHVVMRTLCGARCDVHRCAAVANQRRSADERRLRE